VTRRKGKRPFGKETGHKRAAAGLILSRKSVEPAKETPEGGEGQKTSRGRKGGTTKLYERGLPPNW